MGQPAASDHRPERGASRLDYQTGEMACTAGGAGVGLGRISESQEGETMRIETQRFCRTCQQPRLHARERFGDGWGLLLSFLTCGLFLPVWFLLVFIQQFTDPFRCSRCGSDQRTQTSAELQQSYQLKATVAEERAARRAERSRSRGMAAVTLWAAMRYHVVATVASLFAIAPYIDRALWRILGRENALLVRFTEILIAITLLIVTGFLAAIAWELTGQLYGYALN